MLFLRKSWRPDTRCQSLSEATHFQPSADMEGEHSSCLCLCSRVFSRISSRVVVECHLVFQGILPYGCYFAGWSRPQFKGTSAHFLILSRAKDSTRGKLSFHWPTGSPFPWYDQSWAFLSKENVSFYIKCCIYFCYVHVNLFYQTSKNSGPHAWTYSLCIYVKCLFEGI